MAATIEHLDPWIGGSSDAVAGRAVYELVSPVGGEGPMGIGHRGIDHVGVGQETPVHVLFAWSPHSGNAATLRRRRDEHDRLARLPRRTLLLP